MRLTSEQLEKVKKKYGVDDIWSFSRFDGWRNSHYEWFLKYVKHENPQGETSPYGILGGACHDLLDQWYADEIDQEKMIDDFDTSFATEIEMLGLKFNRADEAKNKSIKNKYYQNLLHFFKNTKKLPYKLSTEKPVIISVADGIVFQGYIDAIFIDEDGVYNILDFKTSSIYKGKDLENHSHQLALYAAGLHQMGVPVDKIRVGFEFLKYFTLTYTQKNGKVKQTTKDRVDLAKTMESKVRKWMKDEGYEELEIENYVNQMLIDNSVDGLPDEIKEKFTIEGCYVWLDDWREIYEDLREEIIDTVAEIEKKKAEYERTGDDKIWWDDDEKLKAQSYFLSQLSEYSVNQLRDYKNYLDRTAEEKEFAGDLLGVGKKLQEDDEFSWMND